MPKTPQKPPSQLRDFQSLVQVVKALRDPENGCPWDLEQTHKSLVKHMIEEAHELVEAIEGGSREHIIEELGDVLLQVILHSEIARQSNSFDILDVIEGLNKKMISRHNHVFEHVSGSVEAKNAEAALANWEQRKLEEKKNKPQKDSFEVPVSLPSLQRASKIGGKTKKFNFDWDNVNQVLKKVDEEIAELRDAIESGSTEHISSELGDSLFSLAQVGRHLDIDPESALRQTNQRFESRFFKMKKSVEEQGKSLSEMKPAELEAAWQEAKKNLS